MPLVAVAPPPLRFSFQPLAGHKGRRGCDVGWKEHIICCGAQLPARKKAITDNGALSPVWKKARPQLQGSLLHARGLAAHTQPLARPRATAGIMKLQGRFSKFKAGRTKQERTKEQNVKHMFVTWIEKKEKEQKFVSAKEKLQEEVVRIAESRRKRTAWMQRHRAKKRADKAEERRTLLQLFCLLQCSRNKRSSAIFGGGTDSGGAEVT